MSVIWGEADAMRTSQAAVSDPTQIYTLCGNAGRIPDDTLRPVQVAAWIQASNAAARREQSRTWLMYKYR